MLSNALSDNRIVAPRSFLLSDIMCLLGEPFDYCKLQRVVER